MQNKNWVNLIFCIDASGSMYKSKEDVVGGFKKTIDEQKAIKDGKVTVSLYTFNSDVTEHYVGKDINDIPEFRYSCDGMTRMNDGIGTAIDNVGKWLYEKDKNGEEMPGLTLFVCMTDGMENASKEYTLKQIQDKIKTQEDVFSWRFIYQGTDITTTKAANDLGFNIKAYATRSDFADNYSMINFATTAYRSMAATGATIAEASLSLDSVLNEEADKSIKKFEKKRGIKMSND